MFHAFAKKYRNSHNNCCLVCLFLNPIATLRQLLQSEQTAVPLFRRKSKDGGVGGKGSSRSSSFDDSSVSSRSPEPQLRRAKTLDIPDSDVSGSITSGGSFYYSGPWHAHTYCVLLWYRVNWHCQTMNMSVVLVQRKWQVLFVRILFPKRWLGNSSVPQGMKYTYSELRYSESSSSLHGSLHSDLRYSAPPTSS